MKFHIYVMLPDLVNPDRTFDKAYVHPELTLNDWPLIVKQDPRLKLSREIHVEFSDQLFLPQGGDNYLKYVGELNTVKQEIFSKIVIGDYSVQEGLDLYRTKAAALHIDEIMQELND
jgi:putative aldouronate transport system substrate-binding protein